MIWFEHVLKRGEATEVGRGLTMEVAGTPGRGRPARRRKDVVEYETRVMRLERG